MRLKIKNISQKRKKGNIKHIQAFKEKKKKNSIHRTTSTFPSHPFIAQRMKKKFYF